MLDIEYSVITSDVIKSFDCSTANIKALRGSLGALSVNKLSHIPKL